MPADILDQLKTLREGIAEGLRTDPRVLTLGALDKSIAEIGGLIGAAAGDHAASPLRFTPDAVAAPAAGSASTPLPGVPPTDGPGTLDHLKFLREGLVAAVRKDPRYLTLSTLDRSIAEIGGVFAGGLGIEAEAMGKPLGHASGTSAPPAKESAHPEPSEDPEPAGHASAVEPEVSANDLGAHPVETVAIIPPTEDLASAVPHDADDHALVDTHAAGDVASHAELADHHDAAQGGDHEPSHTSDVHEPEQSHEPEAVHDAEPSQEAWHDVEAWQDLDASQGSGYRAMAAKPDAAIYQPALGVKFGRLPHRVDLRGLMGPVESQGEIKSCVADAVTAALDCLVRRTTRRDAELSRLFVYYNARWRGGIAAGDGGSSIQFAMESLARFGACTEAAWPFDSHLTLKRPGSEAYQEAAGHRLPDMARLDMARVPLRLDAWKQALAEGKPIVFGCLLFASFGDSPERGGVVPMPSPDTLAEAEHGAHAMCAVGYSDSEQVFIVRNCWGADWGDDGHCYMPYAYLMNPKFNDGDCWVLVPKQAVQPPRDVWSDASTPVTNRGQGVDIPIETYTAAEYDAVTVDFFAPLRRAYDIAVPADYAEHIERVGKERWDEIESVDVPTYLAVAAALSAPDEDLVGEDHHHAG